MTTNPATSAPGKPDDDQRITPVVALRTYTSLRLVSVAVIALLGIAIFREVVSGTPGEDCLQGSISAYYYTPVQSVFVGTLLALGLVMIALWGKTPSEDGVLNLAGLLAPVVAFVPSQDQNRCGLTDGLGDPVETAKEEAKLVAANHDAIDTNMFAYLFVVLVVLILVLAVGVLAESNEWTSITENRVAYWVGWSLAAALWAVGAFQFKFDRSWVYQHAHAWAANLMFVCIGIVVILVGCQKWSEKHRPRPGQQPPAELPFPYKKPGAGAYWLIAGLMALGFVVFKLIPGILPAEISDHRTFWLEAWEIVLLAVFWAFQTRDRWNEGAPPRTDSEAKRMGVSGPPHIDMRRTR